MAITFDSFKNLVSQKNPAYISVSGNTVTLKKGYYLFNETMTFPSFPNSYLNPPSNRTWNRYDYGIINAPYGTSFGLLYSNINSTIVELPANILSIHISQVDLGDFSREVFWYDVKNPQNATLDDFFGYRQGVGWTEPRARALRVREDVSIEYNGSDYSEGDTHLANLCIFLMEGRNVLSYSASSIPDDPGGDLTITKKVVGSDGSELPDTTQFEFSLYFNDISSNPLKFNLKANDKQSYVDIKPGWSFHLSETKDQTGRYEIDNEKLSAYGNVIDGDTEVSLTGTIQSGANDVTFTNIDNDYIPPKPTLLLKISKQVVSADEEDKSIPFSFNATIAGEEKSFTLTHGQQQTYEVENGSSYTITETPQQGFNIKINGLPSPDGIASGTVIGATEVIYSNEKLIRVNNLTIRKIIDNVTSDATRFNFELKLTSINEITQTKNFSLQHGQSITFTQADFSEQLYGSRYILTETVPIGYTAVSNPITGTIMSTDGITITFHNNKDELPPPPHEYDNTCVSGIGYNEIANIEVTEEQLKEFENYSVSGTGEKNTRINEITPDNVAVFRNFALGYNSNIRDIGGVMNIAGHNFNAEITSPTTVKITDGICFAYGYMGYCTGREITFFPPAVEQYQTIYAEIDRSEIPNKISIKTKNNQSSSQVLLNTFRQDALSIVKTGKFQVPLWFVKLSNQGVEELITIRPLRTCIDRVVYSDNTSHISGTIAASATVEGDLKPLDTNDKTVATTEWAKEVIEQEIRR